MPAGSLSNWNAAFATSWMPIARSVPAMVKRPSSNSMSSSDASRRCATSFLPLAIILSLTATMAPPLMVVDDLDPVGSDAQPINAHLGLDRCMALAVGDRAGEEGHAAERIEADFRSLIGGICRLLDGIGDADAAQHAALCRLPAPRLEASPVGKLHGAVEVLRKAP